MNFKLSNNFYLSALFVINFFTTLLIVLGIWPQNAVYCLLLLQLFAILFFDLENALYSVILSVPFYLVLPNKYFDTLSAWRFTFLALFMKLLWQNRKTSARITLNSWDKYLKIFIFFAIISLVGAQFKGLGLKKILFVANVFMLYVVAYAALISKEQIIKAIKISFISIFSIIALGYLQYISTFFTSQYYFWQYWAATISRAYYGNFFAETAAYSNSWFSVKAGQPPSLRMFSVLPSSHAFGLLAVFSLPFMLSLAKYYSDKKIKTLLWLTLFFSVAALLMSGTRGVWAGIIAPVVLLLYFYFRRFGRDLLKTIALPVLIFFALLFASPLIQKAANAIYSKASLTNFLEKSNSIYDLSESSNQGRIMIWKKTLLYVAKNPLLGAGFGNFISSLNSDNLEGKNYEELSKTVIKTYNLPEKYITGHSLYLDILAELGLVGFALLLFYMFDLARNFRNFFKKYYLYSDDPFVVFVVASGFSIAWMFAYSVFDGTLLSDRVLVYFFLILGISASIMREFKGKNNA